MRLVLRLNYSVSCLIGSAVAAENQLASVPIATTSQPAPISGFAYTASLAKTNAITDFSRHFRSTKGRGFRDFD